MKRREEREGGPGQEMPVLILIGLMGSGKTTVGGVLAGMLGAGCADTDQLIEKQTGLPVSRIFEIYGEEYFRDLETRLLEQLPSLLKTLPADGNRGESPGPVPASGEPAPGEPAPGGTAAGGTAPRGMVICAGGGLPVRARNRRLMRELGTTILLTAGEDTLVRRLEGDRTRPLLQGTDLRARIRELADRRMALYLDAADVRVPVDGRTPEEIAEEIIRRVVNRQKG